MFLHSSTASLDIVYYGPDYLHSISTRLDISTIVSSQFDPMIILPVLFVSESPNARVDLEYPQREMVGRRYKLDTVVVVVDIQDDIVDGAVSCDGVVVLRIIVRGSRLRA